MNILVTADTHGSELGMTTVLGRVTSLAPDLLIIAGDITQFGQPQGYVKTLLSAIHTRALVVPGNCDPIGIIREIEQTGATCLHNKKISLDGYTFVGYGGSPPTPFGTPFEIPEDEIANSLRALMEKGVILVTHAPPKWYVDQTAHGLHAGSEAIAAIVEDFQPRLVLCGHVHEARRYETDNGTTFVNPGPAAKGYAALVELTNGIRVTMLE